jgi:hypothetical protein
MQKNPSLRQLIVRTAMGAVLGAFLALALIVTNRQLFELIAQPSPKFLIALLMGALSGLIFTTIEINSPPAKRPAISALDKRRDSRR